MRVTTFSFISMALIAAPLVGDLLGQSPQPEVARSTHGLVLVLSQDQTQEPSDSPQLEACLAHNSPANCARLIVTLKNQGKETLLRYWATCAWTPFGFEIKMSNGNWLPIPPRVKNQQIVCESNVAGYSGFPPGSTYTSKLRLADLGYVLPEAGPHTIRASTGIGGCVASERVEENEILDISLMTSIKCLGGEWPKQPLGEIKSNELEMRVTSSAP